MAVCLSLHGLLLLLLVVHTEPAFAVPMYANQDMRPTASSLRYTLRVGSTPASCPPFRYSQAALFGSLAFHLVFPGWWYTGFGDRFVLVIFDSNRRVGIFLPAGALTQLYIYSHLSKGRYLLGRDSTVSYGTFGFPCKKMFRVWVGLKPRLAGNIELKYTYSLPHIHRYKNTQTHSDPHKYS